MIVIDLKTRRTLCQLKQKDIAKELDITYQQYQKYEYGEIKPNLNRFLKICKILNIEPGVIDEALIIDYFVRNKDDRKKLILKVYEL